MLQPPPPLRSPVSVQLQQQTNQTSQPEKSEFSNMSCDTINPHTEVSAGSALKQSHWSWLATSVLLKDT